MISEPILIYGATGYTGRLLSAAAAASGLRPILCARDEGRLAALAGSLGLEHRTAALDNGIEAALRGIAVVVNAAGPFSSTSGPVARACLRAGSHYLDLSAELTAIEGIARLGAEAAARGVMLMPAVGFDVVASDCLALHAARQLRGAVRLAIGVAGLELMSRGSAATLLDQVGRPARVRRGGIIAHVGSGSLERLFDYGDGPRASVVVDWGDVCTAHHSTGIPNIEVYFEATAPVRMMAAMNRHLGAFMGAAPVRPWLDLHVAALPDGPTEAERARRSVVVVAEVEDSAGRLVRARLRAPEAYTFTCASALAIARRALRGDLERGFQTPARVYGPDFVLSIAGVSRDESHAWNRN